MKRRLHQFAERLLLTVGLTLLVIVGAVLGHRAVASRLALAEFEKSQAAYAEQATQAKQEMLPDEPADTSLWAPNRIKEYKKSLELKKDAPLGVLRLDRLQIRAPIFEGTDELVLNRGLGWIEGTAKPGDTAKGNIGITGHRDGFFRGLKGIAVGDKIELLTLGATSTYTVDSTRIVTPEHVEVLRPRGFASLTLVTCYPFYVIGKAKQRLIVHATLQERVEVRSSQERGSASPRTGEVKTKEKEHDE